MKNKVNNWLLVIGLSTIFSLSAQGQKYSIIDVPYIRDTIKYVPFIVYAQIKDINAYPYGLSQDTFVITHRLDLNKILKIFKVRSFYEPYNIPDSSCNNGINKLYVFQCDCDESLLLDTLNKYNQYHNSDLICFAFLIPRGADNITNIHPIGNFHIYPNPVKNILTIIPPSNIPFKIKIFNSIGGLIYYSDKLTNANSFNLSNNKSGIYYIQISSESQNIINKLIKN